MTKPLNLPSIRLYSPQALAEQVAVSLGVSQSHYLINVMRLKSGAEVRLFHESGGEWRARIEVQGKSATAVALEQTRPPAAPPPLSLAFCPLKSGKSETIVEKATELGVAALYPVISAHTVVDRVNAAKLTAAAVEAAEQCERVEVPAIAPLQPLFTFLDRLPGDTTLIYGDETGHAEPLAEAIPALTPPLCALVGPEGGFSAQELAALRRRPRTVGVTLGPRILKADTAAYTLLACLACHHADWREKPSFRTPHAD